MQIIKYVTCGAGDDDERDDDEGGDDDDGDDDGDEVQTPALSSECAQPPTNRGRFHAPAISVPKLVPCES